MKNDIYVLKVEGNPYCAMAFEDKEKDEPKFALGKTLEESIENYKNLN